MMYYNSKICREFKKQDCPEDLGTMEEFCVEEAQFVSSVSQEEADRRAEEYLSSEGQAAANRVGGCCHVYYSQEMSGEFYSKNCDEGYMQEDPTVYTLSEGAVVSTESQTDADFRALVKLKKEGQAKADSEGVCKLLYWNTPQHGWFKRKCPPGYVTEEKYFSLPAGQVYSFVSVEDADLKAKERLEAEAMDYVNTYMECKPETVGCDEDALDAWF